MDDVLTANLRLAEDRVISYLIILRSPSVGRSECWPMRRGAILLASCVGKRLPSLLCAAAVTSWVPNAQFYFESEETFRELVLQRRRWLNGTLAGYPCVTSGGESGGAPFTDLYFCADGCLPEKSCGAPSLRRMARGHSRLSLCLHSASCR